VATSRKLLRRERVSQSVPVQTPAVEEILLASSQSAMSSLPEPNPR
jgi:hypothetical protein